MVFKANSNEYCAILALTCPLLPNIANGFRDSDDNVIGSVLTYSCLIGYQLPDATNQRTTICLNNQTWSAQVDDCFGELILGRNLQCSVDWTEIILNFTLT